MIVGALLRLFRHISIMSDRRCLCLDVFITHCIYGISMHIQSCCPFSVSECGYDSVLLVDRSTIWYAVGGRAVYLTLFQTLILPLICKIKKSLDQIQVETSCLKMLQNIFLLTFYVVFLFASKFFKSFDVYPDQLVGFLYYLLCFLCTVLGLYTGLYFFCRSAQLG